jgi:hypothetical protein
MKPKITANFLNIGQKGRGSGQKLEGLPGGPNSQVNGEADSAENRGRFLLVPGHVTRHFTICPV